jgi:hypothetical protein
MEQFLKIKKFILLFFILKILMALVFFVIMEPVFGQSVFKFNDFGKYQNLNMESGGNFGYRWLISFLGITSLEQPLPIFLATTMNVFIDVGWIYLFAKYLSIRGLFLFTLMLSLQPYAAIYTMKFTTIIFAKAGLLFFCRELLIGGFNKIKQRTISLAELLFWTFITLVRTTNILIVVPYFFLKLRHNPFKAMIIIITFVCLIYFSSPNYASDVHLLPNIPWSLNYVKELLDIENSFIALPLMLVARVFLLFGAREKLFGEGIEPFLVWGIPGLELCIYLLLACIQFFGFYLAIRFFFKRYGIATLAILIPLGVCILTYSHQRYLIPFIPICLFGLALIYDSKKNNRLK